MKSFYSVTRAKEIPLHVKFDLFQIFSEQLWFAPVLSFPHAWKGKGKAAFLHQYFPDLGTCMCASLL